MKGIKNIDIAEYKEKIVILISFSITIVLIYFLFYKPFINYFESKKELENYGLRVKKEEKMLEAGEKRKFRLEEDLVLEKKKVEEGKERIKKSSFLNLMDFEEYITKIVRKNFLTLEAIGRIERISETDKIYVPYLILGGVESILKFSGELEKSEKGISLSETTVNLEIKDGKGRINCKISANVLDLKDEVMKRDISFRDIATFSIRDIKFVKYDDKKYAIVSYQKGGSEIFYHGKIIDFEDRRYEIVIKGKEIYLKLVN